MRGHCLAWIRSVGRLGRLHLTCRLLPRPASPISFVFQSGVANLTAIIVCSSFAERMRLRSMLAFLLPWHFLVYCPVAHAVWARGGFLRDAGALDFAGGGVAHVCAGFSALAAALAVGPRAGFSAADMRPNNVVHPLIGAGLVWAGWLGFNGGSRLAADGRAGFAVVATHVAASACAVAWMLIEWRHRGRPSVLGIAKSAAAAVSPARPRPAPPHPAHPAHPDAAPPSPSAADSRLSARACVRACAPALGGKFDLRSPAC